MKEQFGVTRRSVIQTAGLAATGLLTGSVRARSRSASANDRVNVAFIGCGAMGTFHRLALLRLRESHNVGLLAACDVNRGRAAQVRDKLREEGIEIEVKQYHPEVMAMRDVDCVVIATPDHNHARIVSDALAAGKHVYVETPMTHTIDEAQSIVARARDAKLHVQVGLQEMSDATYATAHDAIASGAIGDVVHAQTGAVRHYPRERGPWRVTNFRPDMPKPEYIDWNAWLGPAPKRLWEPSRYFEWRCYRGYSGGMATDMLLPRLSQILRATGLEMPQRAVGMGGIYRWPDGREWPDTFEMTLEYPEAEGLTPGLTVHATANMASRHPAERFIRGYDGTLIFTDEGWDIVKDDPRGRPKVVVSHRRPESEDPSLVRHHVNLIEAIRGRGKPNAPPAFAMRSVVATTLANESWIRREVMTFDESATRTRPSA